ncbi:MAG: hypothetical protein PHN18_11100 [Sulfurospirillaceae bacterium]|nr:hypothetical protein [Sulfurospirillaceae bacterium]MDD2826390.1 hypothetical protein [Sulfurospirillaceae bacterium]
MYSKKQKIALIIATTLSFIFALSLYLEGKVRISEYHQHMLYEIHIHYEEKIDDLVKMSGLSLKIISTFLQPYVKNLPERESKPLQELLLMHQKELGDLALNEEGMTHLSIYSLSGELLLDLVEHQEGHKHSSLGHNILLQHAIQTHKITYGYDYDAEFHGFKYIAPLSINSSIIGYIEIAIPFF